MTEVIVMEDRIDLRKTIKNELEKANFKVNLVDNREEAVNFAKEHRIKFFILDINMGNNRDQEGLDTLEEIKKVDPNAFVSILSVHPKYETMSKKSKADMFVLKTPRLGENVQQIIYEMVRYDYDIYNRIDIVQDVPHKMNLVDVNETPPEKQGKIHTPYVSESQTKIQIVTQINRLLMAVCLLSFLFTIIYPFIHPDKPIPDLIQNTFFTTLGWFGGILCAFFKFDQNSDQNSK